VTARLYYNDSHLLAFQAQVVEVLEKDGRVAVVLDRSAFYPTGGGQPNDTGSIDGVAVVDVVEDDAGRVFHLLGAGLSVPVGATVACSVDAERRRDHLQQHTGQHILSQAFVHLFGAATRAFRIGHQTSEIDVDLAEPDQAKFDAAEDLANDVVFDDRAVRAHCVDAAAAASLPLRKESTREGELRVIEIDGFDWSPCGGTHAHRTGEVGLIALRSVERAKGMTRVEFVCGARALADYRRSNRAAVETASLFSTGRDEGPQAVSRVLDENRRLRKRVKELAEVAAEVEARRLYEDASGDPRVVVRTFEGRDADELRQLARQVVQQGPAVALLASDDQGTARLVFARSGGLAFDCGALMREACAAIGGRGGGKPDLAQGGGPLGRRAFAAACESGVATLQAALAAVASKLVDG
jgi:alanyl-tRNA synthetase